MSNQLIKETALGREQVFPKNYILNLKDKDSGANLEDILKSFNMLFLSYLGNKVDTRKQVPMSLRHGGLWITYIVNNTVVTEWYDSTAIDDFTWGSDAYWREGSNMLVGDISISKQGTWVINGKDTGISPKGDKGDSPVIRIYNNRIQVSYDEGNTYTDLNDTPVFTLFRFNSNTNTHLVSYDLGLTWLDVLPDKVYYKFKYNQSTNTYLVSTDLGKTWSNVSADKVFYKFRFNPDTNTHQVSTDLGSNWVDISTEKVFYKFRTSENKLLVSTDLGTTWEDCSELIAAWFRWAEGDTADSIGKLLISRDELKTWTDLSPNIVNNLRIKGYVAAVGNLPSDAALGDIYMVGPTYDESDTTHDYPHYRMWVKLSSGWVDNGEYLSNVLVSQEFGNNSGAVISLKFITEKFSQLKQEQIQGGIYDVSAHNGGAIFESLSALLNNANLSTLIPTSVRCGGMTIRFIQGSVPNSDNKYVQYRLMADAWSIDTDDWAIAEEGVYVENPEFIRVVLDNENKILEAIKRDGTKAVSGDLEVGGGIKILGSVEAAGVSYKVIESPEYLAAWVDAKGKVIFGIKTDGKTYVGDADFLNDIKDIKVFLANITDKNIDWDALSTITTVENPEFIEAKTDSEGKLLAGRTPDGTAFENVGFSTHKVSIDGHIVENIEDPEGRTEIKTDSDGKILSYRDSQGVVHEKTGIESATINTNSLNLTAKGMTEFQQALKDGGFQPGGHGDWSDAKELHIAEPYCAKVNFSGINDIPQQKYSDDDRPQAYMEFWDIKGNYFKKEVLINAQGRSTMAHPKKNIAIDICNNNGWDDSDTFSLQIGDWVPQDSFHLKAFYNDPFRCLSPVAYKLWDEICKSKGEWMDYVWKRALIDFNSITPISTGCADAEEATDEWNTNARCFPMGFPCIVYLNGEFYGIYSWQLKKHRDNYMMSKGKINHIHLDGIISIDTILNANGNTTKIRWTTASPEGFEIRNPKPKKKKDGWDLLIMDGSKYDADANGGELIDETSSAWDANDQSCIKTKQVKDYILNMSKIYPSLKDAYAVYEASSKSPEDKATFKTVYETYFDIDNLVDYLIFSDVLNNYDGFSQNVQWVTYNGVKWYLCAYDLDGVMGNWWQLDNTIVAPNTTHYTYAHFKYLPIFYQSDLEARYKELRDKGILNIEHIYGLVEDWLKRFGAKETFNKEWEKWPSFIKNDNIHRLYKWLEASFANMDSLYNYNQN